MTIESKISDKSAHIGVVGLGYVGLPVACAFAESGFTVTGIDVNNDIIHTLNSGKSHIGDIPDDRLAVLLKEKSFSASTEYSCISQLDVVIIVAPSAISPFLLMFAALRMVVFCCKCRK